MPMCSIFKIKLKIYSLQMSQHKPTFNEGEEGKILEKREVGKIEREVELCYKTVLMW